MFPTLFLLEQPLRSDDTCYYYIVHIPQPRLQISGVLSRLSLYGNRKSAFPSTPRGLVSYAYDPATDELDLINNEDLSHDPSDGKNSRFRTHAFPWRGLTNIIVLVGLILSLLCLSIFYPVLTFYRDEAKNGKIYGQFRVNAAGKFHSMFCFVSITLNSLRVPFDSIFLLCPR